MKRVLLLMLLTGLGAGACARAHAKITPELPPLDMPVPPPRIVEPVEAEAPEPVPLPEEPARRLPPAVRPRPAPREVARPEAPKPEPPKPEVVATEGPKPAEEPPKAPTTLQTTPVATEGEVERAIRATIARATADLNRIDYRVLNADARTQYDTAKRFIRQAEDSIRMKNLVFAKNLADKAAGLAAQLVPR
jgi:hypothetical protein